MIRQIPGSALRLHGLPIRGGTQAGSGRRSRVEPPVRRVLGVLDVRGVKVAIAGLQRAIVLVQIQRWADTGRSGRGATETPHLARRCPYLVRDRGTDPGGGGGRSARASPFYSRSVFNADTTGGWWRFALFRDRLCDNALDFALIAARGETKEFRKKRNPFSSSGNSRGRDLVSKRVWFQSANQIAGLTFYRERYEEEWARSNWCKAKEELDLR